MVLQEFAQLVPGRLGLGICRPLLHHSVSMSHTAGKAGSLLKSVAGVLSHHPQEICIWHTQPGMACQQTDVYAHRGIAVLKGLLLDPMCHEPAGGKQQLEIRSPISLLEIPVRGYNLEAELIT